MVQTTQFYMRSLYVFLIVVACLSIPLGLIDIFTEYHPFEGYIVLPLARLLVSYEFVMPIWMVGFIFVIFVIVSIVWLPSLPLLVLLGIWLVYFVNKMVEAMSMARAVRDAETDNDASTIPRTWREYLRIARRYRPNVLRRGQAPGPADPTPEPQE